MVYVDGVIVVVSILILFFIVIDRYILFFFIWEIRMWINLIFEFINIKVFSYSVFELCRFFYMYNI